MQNHLNNLLFKLSIAYRIANEKMMCEIGLHAGQVQVLSTLWIKDKLSQAEIVREICISPPTVNSLVSKLEKNKFVKRKKCPQDKRLIRVHLTKKGSEIKPLVEKQQEALERMILKDFSDTEKILALMLLEKIKNNLQTDTSEI